MIEGEIIGMVAAILGSILAFYLRGDVSLREEDKPVLNVDKYGLPRDYPTYVRMLYGRWPR